MEIKDPMKQLFEESLGELKSAILKYESSKENLSVEEIDVVKKQIDKAIKEIEIYVCIVIGCRIDDLLGYMHEEIVNLLREQFSYWLKYVLSPSVGEDTRFHDVYEALGLVYDGDMTKLEKYIFYSLIGWVTLIRAKRNSIIFEGYYKSER